MYLDPLKIRTFALLASVGWNRARCHGLSRGDEGCDTLLMAAIGPHGGNRHCRRQFSTNTIVILMTGRRLRAWNQTLRSLDSVRTTAWNGNPDALCSPSANHVANGTFKKYLEKQYLAKKVRSRLRVICATPFGKGAD
jgi:hypothetical protein